MEHNEEVVNEIINEKREITEEVLEDIQEKLREKQRKHFKIQSTKKLIKYLASDQRELRKIDQSKHSTRRGMITALLNYYNQLRGKPLHAKIDLKTYQHKYGYKAAKNVIIWHLF